MATPDNSPHLKRVLHTYKSQAMNSLQGPGSQHHIIEAKGLLDESNTSPYYYGHKKKTHYEEITRTSYIDSCKKCDIQSEEIPLHCKVRPKYSSAADVGWHASLSRPNLCDTSPVLSQASRECDIGGVEKEIVSPSKRDGGTIVIVKNDCKAPDISITKSEDLFIPDEREGPHLHSVKDEDPSDSRRENGNFKWVEPQLFLAPAPFPPQPLPVLASADPGVVPSNRRSETYLDGNPIACFTIGGEPRLCLPQILNTVLRNFSLTQINAVCDELQIFCSRCIPKQLEYLRDTGVLPPTATSCGLITKTDASRLTHSLLYAHISRPPPKKLMHAHDKNQQIMVSHNCFGKCRGAIWPEVYNEPSDPCIVCLECTNMFTTSQFVCHAHRAFENRTCHWGFETENWRSYLMLSKDQVMPLHKAEADLQAFKNKFNVNFSGSQKRKQCSESTEEFVKKVKGEDISSMYSSVGNYDTVLANYLAWGAYSPKPPSWAVVPLVTKDGKSLPLPPAVFAKESIPSTLPSYLSQGPPVLLDPGRVVPMSESEKFERNYQPNVALAPPKIRDKMAREALESERIKAEHYGTVTPCSSQVIYQNSLDLIEKEPKCIKVERSPRVDPDSLISIDRIEPKELEGENKIFYVKVEVSPSSSPLTSPSASTPTRCSMPSHEIINRNSSQKHSNRSHRVPSRGDSVSERLINGYPPDLVLSTTDSDTESVSSVTSKSEVVEEAEALLRGWTDRAAAHKVLDIVASLTKLSTEKDRQLEEASRQKVRLQKKIQIIKADLERQQLLPKEEQLLEKVSLLEKEIQDLRDSVQLPTAIQVKKEPFSPVE